MLQGVTLGARSTPGPTYYRFKLDSDSATEDVLSCKTADSSFVFDIDAIDFSWKPFLRSKVSDGHPVYQRENDTSQQMSPYSPVSEALVSDGLGPHGPIYTDINPTTTTSPLAYGQNVRPVCLPPISDDPTDLLREGPPYLLDKEEHRMSSSERALPDERPVEDARSRCSHPRGEGEHLKPPRLVGMTRLRGPISPFLWQLGTKVITW